MESLLCSFSFIYFILIQHPQLFIFIFFIYLFVPFTKMIECPIFLHYIFENIQDYKGAELKNTIFIIVCSLLNMYHIHICHTVTIRKVKNYHIHPRNECIFRILITTPEWILNFRLVHLNSEHFFASDDEEIFCGSLQFCITIFDSGQTGFAKLQTLVWKSQYLD